MLNMLMFMSIAVEVIAPSKPEIDIVDAVKSQNVSVTSTAASLPDIGLVGGVVKAAEPAEFDDWCDGDLGPAGGKACELRVVRELPLPGTASTCGE